MAPGDSITFTPMGRHRQIEGTVTAITDRYVRVVADGKHYTIPKEEDAMTEDRLFEPTDYDRRKNVERALIETISHIQERILETQKRIADLYEDLERAETALADFRVLEPERADANGVPLGGVMDRVAEVVNAGALDHDGVTVRAEVRK